MLGLKLATDERWVAHVLNGNLQEILTDHAYCEQKAASHAISLIVHFPEHSELVTNMTELAREEMEHFGQVHAELLRRGMILGRERKDNYVNELVKFVRKGGHRQENLLDQLLFAAMIEARSCERFKVLSENMDDRELAAFYRDLMISEARHYTSFLKLARQLVSDLDVDARWEAWLAYEAEVIARYGNSERIHG